jgi:ribonucleotide reductase alpha subunit
MGIGVQGWANVFARLGIPLVVYQEGKKVINPKARELNFWIFECMYITCLRESIRLAAKDGPYPKFETSKASKGILQPDEWDMEFYEGYNASDPAKLPPSRYSKETWDDLREKSKTIGWRNQFFMALMPTATTAHILNNNECFEPFTQMIYSRTLISGQYAFIVKECFDDLAKLGVWNSKTVSKIYKAGGTLQCLNSQDYPEDKREELEKIKLKYLTAYEIPMDVQLDFATDRNRFVCQSSSFNWFIDVPDADLYYSTVMKAWYTSNKTLLYYIKARPRSDPIKFSKIKIPIRDETGDEVCVGCVV